MNAPRPVVLLTSQWQDPREQGRCTAGRIHTRVHTQVKEVSGSMKQLLVIPSHAIAKFQEAISLALMERPLHEDAAIESGKLP